MKIAIINISDKIGGSAIAAFRTGESLEKDFNQEIFYVVRTQSLQRQNIFKTRQNKFQDSFEKYFNAITGLLGLQYVWLPFSPAYILKKIKSEKPDVIWLNNSLGGYFTTDSLISLSKIAPIVWTMHDMWPFTASGAHTFGAENWKELKSSPNEKKVYPTIGINTGNWLLKRKQKIYKQSDITFVAPSNWLKNLAAQSPVINKEKLLRIPHGLDLNTFKPLDKTEARKKSNIPEDGHVIMFSAQKLKNNFFKGGNDLIDILTELDQKSKQKIYVILTGEERVPEIENFNNVKPLYVGYISKEEDMIRLYNCADIFIYPTRADNLPLVLMEAVACGIPCVSYLVGGVSDMIDNNYNGYLIQNFDAQEAAAKTIYLLEHPEELKKQSLNARKSAEEKFSIEKVARTYLELFQKLKR